MISYTQSTLLRMPQWMHPTATSETRLSMKQSKCSVTLMNLEQFRDSKLHDWSMKWWEQLNVITELEMNAKLYDYIYGPGSWLIIVFTRNRRFGTSLYTAGYCQKQLLLTFEKMEYKDKIWKLKMILWCAGIIFFQWKSPNNKCLGLGFEFFHTWIYNSWEHWVINGFQKMKFENWKWFL